MLTGYSTFNGLKCLCKLNRLMAWHVLHNWEYALWKMKRNLIIDELVFSSLVLVNRGWFQFWPDRPFSLQIQWCTVWRRGVRSIWNLPYTTHCYLLPLICQCLPVFDELCRRSINFMRSCVSHESKLISTIASHCIHFARCKSPMDLNILFCADRYQTNIDDILSGSSTYIVHSHYNRSIGDIQLHASSFLSELISIRDSRQSFLVTSLSPKRNWPI